MSVQHQVITYHPIIASVIGGNVAASDVLNGQSDGSRVLIAVVSGIVIHIVCKHLDKVSWSGLVDKAKCLLWQPEKKKSRKSSKRK
jgi:hypothetical protein